MPPYATLDDDTLAQLRAAAAALPADCRAEFIQAVTAALAGVEPGPGVLYRTIAPLQRLYLSGDRPRYPHQRWGRAPEAESG
jgi:plasmid stability protein